MLCQRPEQLQPGNTSLIIEGKNSSNQAVGAGGRPGKPGDSSAPLPTTGIGDEVTGVP